jgi:hypothetical protein
MDPGGGSAPDVIPEAFFATVTNADATSDKLINYSFVLKLAFPPHLQLRDV